MSDLADPARRGAVIVIVTEGRDCPQHIQDALDANGIAHCVVSPAQLNAAFVGGSSRPRRRVLLARRRKELGRSQEALAREIGVERTTVARWEAGGTEPSVWCRAPLAEALRIPIESLDDLLRGSSSPSPLTEPMGSVA